MNAQRLNTNTLDLQTYIDTVPKLARLAENVAKSLAGLGLHKPALIINDAVQTMKIIRYLFEKRSHEVFISVAGGVASIDKCPDHIAVYIYDTDIPYCDICGSNEGLSECDECGTILCLNCIASGTAQDSLCCKNAMISLDAPEE